MVEFGKVCGYVEMLWVSVGKSIDRRWHQRLGMTMIEKVDGNSWELAVRAVVQGCKLGRRDNSEGAAKQRLLCGQYASWTLW